jgi:hypothetical protein
MSELNLHGRLPEDLPDKETIDDILLELEDTKKFEINWVSLNPILHGIWSANNKPFEQWIESGQVNVMKFIQPKFNITEDWSTDPMTIPMSKATYKEYRYDIHRYPTRLEVKFKNYSLININKDNKELIEMSNETYLRLKDYLGPDLIQDQFGLVNFTIDFMISRYKIIYIK